MKIAMFGVEKGDEDIFKDSLPRLEISFAQGKLDENTAPGAKDAEIVSVFVDSVVDKSIIDSLSNLKFIAVRATGYDNIDHEYAKSKGIAVSNVPAYGSHTVAEFAFGLILNLSRNVIKANNYIRSSSDFNYFPVMEGFDLLNKNLGVIGTGKIGKNVVRIAKGFGMNVLAYDLFPDQAFAKENNFEYKSFDEVISGADVITLHAPYSKENHHLINKNAVSKMKKGVFVVNTARGELIDTDALIWGLKEKIIAGAGLDVLEGERELKDEIEILAASAKPDKIVEYRTLLEDRILIDMPNVIITPHISFYTKEAVAEISRVTIENIKGFVSGSPVNLVR